MSTGLLFIISAPSGAGKTSLVKALIAQMPDLVVSISHTTRAQRPGEQDGVDYHFVDHAAFKTLVEQDAFLEHAHVFGQHYGTARQTVAALLSQGIDVILEIDWQGAQIVRARLPQARSIFILPPSREALKSRLCARGQDAPEVIDRRLAKAIDEMAHVNEFDFLVINDRFEQALADLQAIIHTHRLRTPIQMHRYSALIARLLDRMPGLD